MHLKLYKLFLFAFHFLVYIIYNYLLGCKIKNNSYVIICKFTFNNQICKSCGSTVLMCTLAQNEFNGKSSSIILSFSKNA